VLMYKWWVTTWSFWPTRA